MSKKYSCTNSTIIRNLKKNLGELKYEDLINKSKSSKEQPKVKKNLNNDFLNPKNLILVDLFVQKTLGQ